MVAAIAHLVNFNQSRCPYRNALALLVVSRVRTYMIRAHGAFSDLAIFLPDR
jgi:hypothetical protein